MQLLWIILRALFPTDPVRQCTEALREHVRHLVEQVFSEEGLRHLENDADARRDLEEIINDYECSLQLVIGGRACQIAKMPFRPGKRAIHRPARAASLSDLLARIGDLADNLEHIESLAQARAEKLMRERDADPLGLAATQRATSPGFARGGKAPVFFLLQPKAGGGGSPRLRGETEGAATGARDPPVFDV